MLHCSSSKSTSIWFLTGRIKEDEPVQKLPIHETPFQIGRRPDVSLWIPFATISKLHAEIIVEDGALSVRDLGSTNGTFVNGMRIQSQTPLLDNDLVQFSNNIFRVRRESRGSEFRTLGEAAGDKAQTLIQFDHLMTGHPAEPVFQPIIEIQTRQTVGYESLGRSHLQGLETPAEMFQAAAELGVEAELSRMLRIEAVKHARLLPGDFNLFLNTHPIEVAGSCLDASLEELRAVLPHTPITLEIHEAAVTDPKAMIEWRAVLSDFEIGLAYDDFGSGQARLVELIEVPPDYLKFDRRLVQGIHVASEQRQKTLGTLVRMARDLGIVPLAEGVESENESVACGQLGFSLAQGYYYGRPVPANRFPAATR